MEEKKNNKKKYLIVVGILLCVCIIVGVTFAYYSATVTKVNETNTKIQTNTLGLVYDGTKEINYQSMIPGDSFEKTFTVENTSNTAVTYNIYMEEITNEYNEDLVYTLYETDSSGNNPVEVVSETLLPATNEGKWYLKTNISINAAPTIKYYKLVVEYKYLANAPQNDYQGKVFEATLGIDTVQNASNPSLAWTPTFGTGTTFQPIYFSINNPTTSDVTKPAENVFVGMDAEENKGICIYTEGLTHCFQYGAETASYEQTHLQQVFNGENDLCEESDRNAYPAGYGYWTCESATSGFGCEIHDAGIMKCWSDSDRFAIVIQADSSVSGMRW